MRVSTVSKASDAVRVADDNTPSEVAIVEDSEWNQRCDVLIVEIVVIPPAPFLCIPSHVLINKKKRI